MLRAVRLAYLDGLNQEERDAQPHAPGGEHLFRGELSQQARVDHDQDEKGCHEL